ncbi:MAG TPA: triose-phosphate isomerase [Dictyobacter sp.]|nr:triose-phosphate isomerase [Dictyobacter sp.]
MATSRTAIVAANWKMNYGPQQASSFTTEILPGIGTIVRAHSNLLCILCPPTISLLAVREVMDALPTQGVELGTQNMYYEEKGAFTGETAPGMVKELCTTVILGHSERRSYFGETDEIVNKKLLAALRYNLRPIVCIGENLEQYEAGQTEKVIHTQIQQSLAHLSEQQASQIVIAYEPIWAIGTGKAATTQGAQKVIHSIRQSYSEMYGKAAGDTIRILYGGSVTTKNIGDFMLHDDIDGVLVGGASLLPEFVELVRKAAEAKTA